MKTWIIDVDGSLPPQAGALESYQPQTWTANVWGPRIRLGCGFGQFRRFEQALWSEAGRRFGGERFCALYGSGDFHHVSLALLRRLMQPCNLLVLDKHPDWMRGIPLLHCGTWLNHAARLPHVRQVFHVGGDLDFDNGFRPLAPWPLLRSQKIVVFPAVRRFRGGAWERTPHTPLRDGCTSSVDPVRLRRALRPWRAALARWPLYISIDKDVLAESAAIVNWDSGRLLLPELCTILTAFVEAARGKLAGMDCLGDWSPVRVAGICRRLLHLTEHPTLHVDAAPAALRNAAANRAILDCVHAACRPLRLAA